MSRRQTWTQIANAEAKRRRENERQRIAFEKQQERLKKVQYADSRSNQAIELNLDTQNSVQDLTSILAVTLDINDEINFDDLKSKEQHAPFPQNEWDKHFLSIKKPSFIGSLFGEEKKYTEAIKIAQDQYQAAIKAHKSSVDEFEQKKAQRSIEVDNFRSNYFAGDPEAISAYINMVLERSQYPEDFPQNFRIAYVPESKELAIDYELPTVSIVPEVSEYKYVKSKDSISKVMRKAADIKSIYEDIISGTCLRTIHEIFESDRGKYIEIVIFSGYINTVDPATGSDIKPYLVSVRTTRDIFLKINLNRVDKKVCLRNLGAQVSPHPEETQAVKPVVEFNMYDKRFVDQADIISELDSRPNLMDLDPFEFENLVSNLFNKMGLDTKQTVSSKDGGVDAVAFDPRPILGGKVVIQAKRYKNTVGVSAVRDLYGTMLNEGASKGILVTTSHYGPDAYNFQKDKPLELIDGGGLLYLLDNVGISARIIFPED